MRKRRTRKSTGLYWFIWVISVIVSLAIGIYAGCKVTQAYKDMEIADVQAQLETANASLAEANAELAFWQSAVDSLAAGNQLPGVQEKIDGKEEEQ